MMKPHIDLITLGVSDLERALAFYGHGLGLSSDGIIGREFPGSATEPSGKAAFFELRGGLILALYAREDLAKDATTPVGPHSSTEFSLGYAVASRAEVDAILQRAQAHGATLTQGAHDRAWGIYSGYFKDPDGHLWEVFWNPRMTVSE
jgi:uncharacterized protein